MLKFFRVKIFFNIRMKKTILPRFDYLLFQNLEAFRPPSEEKSRVLYICLTTSWPCGSPRMTFLLNSSMSGVKFIITGLPEFSANAITDFVPPGFPFQNAITVSLLFTMSRFRMLCRFHFTIFCIIRLDNGNRNIVFYRIFFGERIRSFPGASLK